MVNDTRIRCSVVITSEFHLIVTWNFKWKMWSIISPASYILANSSSGYSFKPLHHPVDSQIPLVWISKPKHISRTFIPSQTYVLICIMSEQEVEKVISEYAHWKFNLSKWYKYQLSVTEHNSLNSTDTSGSTWWYFVLKHNSLDMQMDHSCGKHM